MGPFRIRLWIRPNKTQPGADIQIGAHTISTLRCETLDAPFAVTFEEVEDACRLVKRMFLEPDGAFVWSGEENGSRWQVDGHLYDRNGRLLFIELQGVCPPDRFRQFIRLLQSDDQQILVELVMESAIVELADFARIAASNF